MTAAETPDQAREERAAPVVACTLGSLDLASQAKRWTRLRGGAELGRVETDDGLRLSFRDEPGVERELLALVAVENECCAWASWEVCRETGALVMQASSTGAGIATLHTMFKGPATESSCGCQDEC
jgi:hypothetical protein